MMPHIFEGGDDIAAGRIPAMRTEVETFGDTFQIFETFAETQDETAQVRVMMRPDDPQAEFISPVFEVEERTFETPAGFAVPDFDVVKTFDSPTAAREFARERIEDIAEDM